MVSHFRMISQRRFRPERGSQLVELGLVLPILFLLIVGIWDLGSAIAMKQKLTNAAREAARISASNSTNKPLSCATAAQPAPCCTGSTPCSIEAAANAAFQYLHQANIDTDNCLSGATPTKSVYTWTWTCSSNSAELKINHADVTIVNGVANLNTRVTLIYPSPWQIGNFLGVSWFPKMITVHATMLNLAT